MYVHSVCVCVQHVRTYSFLLFELWELNVVVSLGNKHYPHGAVLLACPLFIERLA